MNTNEDRLSRAMMLLNRCDKEDMGCFLKGVATEAQPCGDKEHVIKHTRRFYRKIWNSIMVGFEKDTFCSDLFFIPQQCISFVPSESVSCTAVVKFNL